MIDGGGVSIGDATAEVDRIAKDCSYRMGGSFLAIWRRNTGFVELLGNPISTQAVHVVSPIHVTEAVNASVVTWDENDTVLLLLDVVVGHAGPLVGPELPNDLPCVRAQLKLSPVWQVTDDMEGRFVRRDVQPVDGVGRSATVG